MPINEAWKKLQTDSIFLSWKKNHPKVYLSHFFCALDQNLQGDKWEIGFFDPQDQKITVFSQLEKDFAIKPAEDVFKQKEDRVEELHLHQMKIGFAQALQIFDQNKEERFPKEAFGSGFAILQTLKDQVVWNLTVITRTLKFANLKINAISGEIVSHELIDFVQKNNLSKK
jgi:hypothetical protein